MVAAAAENLDREYGYETVAQAKDRKVNEAHTC